MSAAPADIVLLHGKIITVNASDDVVDALAISGDTIVRLGSDEAMRAVKDADIDQSEWETYRVTAADAQLSANVCVLFRHRAHGLDV